MMETACLMPLFLGRGKGFIEDEGITLLEVFVPLKVTGDLFI